MTESGWTRDRQGRFVDWSQPPYRTGGILRLVLEGENPDQISDAVHERRLAEYYRLIRSSRYRRAAAASA